MDSCQLYNPKTPRQILTSPPFIVAFILAFADFAITFYGITHKIGYEANPIFKHFTDSQFHMILGAVLFGALSVSIIVFLWLDYQPFGSIVLGAWAGSHSMGFASWITLGWLHITNGSGYIYIMGVMATIGAGITAWSLVRIKTCPAFRNPGRA